MLSAFLISKAFEGWANEPTITTLDTIAAPIDDVQFPTITICNDYIQNPPENWGFLENVLNQWEFQCNDHEACKRTDPLRKDFDFILKSIGDKFTKWLLKEENLNNSSRIIEDLPINMASMINKINEKISQGLMTMDEFKKFPQEYIAKELKILNKDLEINKDETETCTSSDCKKIFVLTKLIHYLTKHSKGIGRRLYFGSLLRNFIGNFRTFDLLSINNPGVCTFSLFTCGFNVCARLKRDEKLVHASFANLSKLIGFEDAISLYELPGILSFDQKKPLTSQLFYFQRCSKYHNVNLKYIHKCNYYWELYREQLNDEIGNYILSI